MISKGLQNNISVHELPTELKNKIDIEKIVQFEKETPNSTVTLLPIYFVTFSSQPPPRKL